MVNQSSVLRRRREELAALQCDSPNWSKVQAWIAGVTPLLQDRYPNHLDEFRRLSTPKWISLPRVAGGEDSGYVNTIAADKERTWNNQVAKNTVGEILSFLDGLLELEASEPDEDRPPEDPVALLEQLFSRFHAVARQLRQRHNDRETLVINDEYDVQDLLHALLRTRFDDIRPEDWVPSYAGGNSRVDFVLKPERTLVEVKKTRVGLEERETGEQLSVDVARYRGREDCKRLVCFVYDPEGRIGNPAGLIGDLEALSSDALAVRVFVFPK